MQIREIVLPVFYLLLFVHSHSFAIFFLPPRVAWKRRSSIIGSTNTELLTCMSISHRACLSSAESVCARVQYLTASVLLWACVGGSARMTQFFRGNLAGLMIRSGKLENKKVIDCLYTCKEGLDVQLPEEVASAVKVSVCERWLKVRINNPSELLAPQYIYFSPISV